MKVVATRCRDDNCPRLVVDDEAEEVYVQGVAVPGWPAVSLGPGEGVVRMSTDDFEELLAQYVRSGS